MKNITVLGLLAAVLCVAGCESEADKALKAAQEEQRVLEAARAAERALFEQRKQEFLANPDSFLGTDALKFYDKGFINSYRELTDVTVSNSSALTVRVKGGHVRWLTDDGSELGSSPLTLDAVLAPGARQALSKNAGTLKSGTIEGNAKRAVITFDNVEVVESAQR